MVGRLLSFWDFAYFQVRTVSFRECRFFVEPPKRYAIRESFEMLTVNSRRETHNQEVDSIRSGVGSRWISVAGGWLVGWLVGSSESLFPLFSSIFFW